MKKLLGIVVLGLLLNSNAYADRIDSTRNMLKACKTAMSGKTMTDEVLQHTLICKMYFQGAWSGAIVRNTQFLLKMEKMDIEIETDTFAFLGSCIPNKTTLNQFINVFINHMDRNPEKLDDLLMINISEASKEIFPCKSK